VDKITVIVNTFDKGYGKRTILARDTIEALVKHLRYPELNWIIADNGSPKHEEHTNIITEPLIDIDHVVLNVQHGGVGLAKNEALTLAFETSPYVFITEDDWRLDETLDLESHLEVMKGDPAIGMIRFGYLGGEMLAKYTDYGAFRTYWTLIPDSGLYVYSGQVSLRNQLFYDKVGWHSPGVEAGQEELDMCYRYNALKENAPKILWPAQYGTVLNHGPFKNTGLGDSLNAEPVR